MKQLVILTKKTPYQPEDLDQLSYQLKISSLESLTQQECDNVEGLITMLSDKIDSQMLDRFPKLRVISNYAVGLDNIDVQECTKRNIMVCHTPDVLTQASADHAFALLLNCARHVHASANAIKEGRWKGWGPSFYLGRSLHGKKLGIIGPGRIAEAFTKLCVEAFDMEVYYFGRSRKTHFEKQFKAKFLSLDELIRTTDVISLHTPLSEKTFHLIEKDKLFSMKKETILINTSRGQVIKQDDLVDVLESGHLYSVGLDVSDPEPLSPEHPLLKYERVTLTPHIASAEKETRENMSWLCFSNIEEGLHSRRPPTLFNSENFHF